MARDFGRTTIPAKYRRCSEVSRIAEAQETIVGEWLSLVSLREETRHNWRDTVAELFEREFWSEMEVAVPRL